jgi:hypothetical protein
LNCLKDLNIGGNTIAAAISDTTGTQRAKLREMYNIMGDLGRLQIDVFFIKLQLCLFCVFFAHPLAIDFRMHLLFLHPVENMFPNKEKQILGHFVYRIFFTCNSMVGCY